MMKFEEEYKKRFQGEQSIDNVNVDDIWNNVSKQLDAQKAGVSNKSKRKFLFILGFIGLFFITGTFLWLDHVPSSEVSSSILEENNKTFDTAIARVSSEHNDASNDFGMSNKSSQQQNIGASKELEGKHVRINDSTLEQDKIDLRSSSNSEHDEDIIQQNDHNNKMAIHTANSANRIENKKSHQVSDLNVNDANNVKQHDVKLSSDRDGTLPKGKGQQTIKAKEISNSPLTDQNIHEKKNEKTAPIADPLKIFRENEQIFGDKQIELERLDPIIYSFEHNIDHLSIEKRNDWGQTKYYDNNSLAPSEISYSVGGVMLNNTFPSNSTAFGSDIKERLTNSSKKAWGYSSSLRATWKRKRIVRLSLGLDLDHFREIYDNVTTQQTTVNEEGHIIGLEVDSIGNTIPVFGTLPFDATETHTILHHNSYKMLTIPIEIGIEKKFNRLSLGIGAGVGYSMFLSQTGRTYNEEGVLVYFDNKDEKLPLKSSAISYHIKSHIGYSINERIDLRILPSLRFLPIQNSPLYGIKRSSKAFSMKFGLTYKLK